MNYGLRERYEQLKKRGDKLAEIKNVIDWESLRPMLKDLFTNDTEQGGRSNYDEILMVKILFPQSIHNILDESMEIEVYDSVRFINFLDYSEKVPDQNTIWLFRERLPKTGKDKALWKKIWKQFKEKDTTVKNGTIQDATFVTSDHGHRRKDKPEMVDPQMPHISSEKEYPDPEKKTRDEMKSALIDERKHSLTRRSKDGSWTEKNSKSYFGFKLHTVQGVENDMIANYAVTTASIHDSQRDLSIPGVVNNKDKGYFSVEGKGIDATMGRAVRGHKLPIESIRRNLRITRKRSRGEKPCSFMKITFRGGHTFVTTVPRVRVKAMFMCLGHNLFNLLSLTRKGKIASAIAVS